MWRAEQSVALPSRGARLESSEAIQAVAERTQKAAGIHDGDMAEGDTLENALIGAVVNAIAGSVLLFSPVVGAAVAGDLQGGSRFRCVHRRKP